MNASRIVIEIENSMQSIQWNLIYMSDCNYFHLILQNCTWSSIDRFSKTSIKPSNNQAKFWTTALVTIFLLTTFDIQS